MSPGWFASVNVVGTVIRVAVIRVIGRVAAGRVDAALDILAEYRTVATGATALVAAVTAAPLVLGLVRWMRGKSIKVV
jgi:membrane protein DedA with SNARE-associated domain